MMRVIAPPDDSISKSYTYPPAKIDPDCAAEIVAVTVPDDKTRPPDGDVNDKTVPADVFDSRTISRAE